MSESTLRATSISRNGSTTRQNDAGQPAQAQLPAPSCFTDTTTTTPSSSNSSNATIPSPAIMDVHPTKNRAQLRTENEDYMRRHPEVKSIMRLYMSEVLKSRPVDEVGPWSSAFFTQPTLREKVEEEQQRQQQQSTVPGIPSTLLSSTKPMTTIPQSPPSSFSSPSSSISPQPQPHA
ncbi:riia domain-containing protein 1-like [Nannochloropsis oceanica]